MFKQVDYTMVIVSDMSKSVKFYRDILGLPLKMESPMWTEFKNGSATLALHGGGVAQKAPLHGKEGEGFAGTCSIGFQVDDVQKTYEALKTKGVRFVKEPERQEKEGIKLAVAIDPDGLPLSFAEMLQK